MWKSHVEAYLEPVPKPEILRVRGKITTDTFNQKYRHFKSLYITQTNFQVPLFPLY